MVGRTFSTRLPGWLEAELREAFHTSGEGASEGLRRIVEEWWAMDRYPKLEFRDGAFERRVALRDGPEVWEIVYVQREYGADLEGLCEHFGSLDREAIDQALQFYRRCPAAIDRKIDENERVGRRLEGEWTATPAR